MRIATIASLTLPVLLTPATGVRSTLAHMYFRQTIGGRDESN